jgi:hypothetical protein
MATIEWVVLSICLKFLALLGWTLLVDKVTKYIKFWMGVQTTYCVGSYLVIKYIYS